MSIAGRIKLRANQLYKLLQTYEARMLPPSELAFVMADLREEIERWFARQPTTTTTTEPAPPGSGS